MFDCFHNVSVPLLEFPVCTALLSGITVRRWHDFDGKVHGLTLRGSALALVQYTACAFTKTALQNDKKKTQAALKQKGGYAFAFAGKESSSV